MDAIEIESGAGEDGASQPPHAPLSTMEAEIFEILPGFRIAHALAPGGLILGVIPKTPGVTDFDALQVGQRLRCVVGSKFNFVLKADFLP